MTGPQIAIAYIFYALFQAILVIRWNDNNKSTFLVLIAAILAPAVTVSMICDFVDWLIGVAVGRNK